MVDFTAEALAEEVLDAFEVREFPVDPLAIAATEKIDLTPSTEFGPEFHGRLEYLETKGEFVLYFPVRTIGSISPRGRFSVAHELGHFYNDEDRAYLLNAGSHWSNSGFICDDEVERRADAFAAALLMPRFAVEPLFSQPGLMKLSALKETAARFVTSIQCAAVRYAQLTPGASTVIISRNGRRDFQTNSDKALHSGARGVRKIPDDSLVAKMKHSQSDVAGCDTWSTNWFGEYSTRFRVREEAIALDSPGYFMTILSWD